MGHDFALTTEIVAHADIVRGKVVAGLAVPDQDGVICFNWLTLAFKSVVRIK